MVEQVKIEFSLQRNFLGRNGEFIAKGIEISAIPAAGYPFIRIYPITSKGNVGRCFIEIPKESIPDLIKFLQDKALTL